MKLKEKEKITNENTPILIETEEKENKIESQNDSNNDLKIQENNDNTIILTENENKQNNNNEITNIENDEENLQENSLEKNSFKIINNYQNRNRSDVLTIFGILTFIFILIILITFITFTLINTKSQTIAHGISIKGIDISGLTKEEATQKISTYISSSIPQEIKLKHNDYETSLSTEQLSVYFNTNEAVEIAYEIGKNGNIFENNFVILKSLFSKTNIDPGFSIDEEQLKNSLQDISNKLPDKVIESSCYIDGNNLIITKGHSGNVIKIEESAKYIKYNINNLNLKDNQLQLITEEQSPTQINLDAIYNEIHKEPINAYYTQNPYRVIPSENGLDFEISLEEAKQLLQEEKDEYTIPLKVLYPNVTTNMIGTEAFPDLLSNFSTKYSASNRNRTTNLILAANKINGTVLMPGETFSYNKTVGARTIAAGYKEAPIYVSGKVEDGLGGGICQITTTLYNAVLYANLEVTERSNHQFVPSYAGASRDATVVYGAIDFKFKNNREYPIKITCSVSNGIANFKIFGLKSENDYEVQITSRITRTTSNAIYSEAYKTLKKNGNVVSTERISKDTYKRH